ncbi:hypothetical protein TNCV_182111 [Trichonephila clavipes]|nr:hypothetical protein TNCV_182111 [Trichonephila clavipes]
MDLEDNRRSSGGTLPPPKPQRSFQQALTPLGKTVRSTPPPTGPPPSIPSPRSGQPRPLVPSSFCDCNIGGEENVYRTCNPSVFQVCQREKDHKTGVQETQH